MAKHTDGHLHIFALFPWCLRLPVLSCDRGCVGRTICRYLCDRLCGSALVFCIAASLLVGCSVSGREVLESSETEWDVTNPDPQYHWDMILGAMKATAQKLPKVDAIGGSATGTVSADSEATWCDIFPNVPPDVYKDAAAACPRASARAPRCQSCGSRP